jgi:hypothetical protein
MLILGELEDEGIVEMYCNKICLNSGAMIYVDLI